MAADRQRVLAEPFGRLANPAFPFELSTGIGPPLLHPTDPRQAYLTHEKSLLEDLTAEY